MFSFFKKRKSIHASTVKVSRQELRERKWERMQKKKLRWGALRHYIMLDELSQATNFYKIKEVANHWANTDNIVNDITDFELTEYDFVVLKRFVRLKRVQGLCEDMSNLSDPSLLDYQQDRILNLEPHLYRMYDEFESYWDEVIDDYKGPSAKSKRLAYLVETLDNQLVDPITDITTIQLRIKGLITKYQGMLDSMNIRNESE